MITAAMRNDQQKVNVNVVHQFLQHHAASLLGGQHQGRGQPAGQLFFVHRAFVGGEHTQRVEHHPQCDRRDRFIGAAE